MAGEALTRRELRHAIMRRRNARINESRDDRLPVQITLHPDTWDDVRLDGDPAEQASVYFGDPDHFGGIPVQGNPRLPYGEIELTWPAPLRS